MALLLEGQVEQVGDRDDEIIAEQRERIRRLTEDLAAARREALRAQRAMDAALGALRRQLTPLFRALQAVFGELDAAGVVIGEAGGTAPDPRASAVWEAWKQRLPGGPAKIIDALLMHGELNTQQVAIAIGVHRNSVPQMIFRLNKAGLIQKNGGRFSLRPLG